MANRVGPAIVKRVLDATSLPIMNLGIHVLSLLTKSSHELVRIASSIALLAWLIFCTLGTIFFASFAIAAIRVFALALMQPWMYKGAIKLSSMICRILNVGPPEISSDDIAKIPTKTTVLCKPEQFDKKNIRASDVKDAVAFGTCLEAPSDTVHLCLDTDKLFVQICTYLRPTHAIKFAMTSKRCYGLLQHKLDEIHPHRYFETRFNCNIQEQLFKTTKAFDQYLLYAFLCNRFCATPLGYSKELLYAKPHLGDNFIRHLIEQLGPFTFLSIPYVDNFGLEMNPKHPIERTTVKRYDVVETGYVTEMRLRLRVKLTDGATTVQEIAQRDCDWTFSNENGLWPKGKGMEEKHVTALIELFQAQTGVPVAFPIHFGMQNRLVHATLEPPLSSLRKTEL
jgi:hypothetical protein